MSISKYSLEVIDQSDLILLRDFSLNFLQTWPYCVKYKDLLLAITLCQGAANHYAVSQGYAKRYFNPEKAGVKDFDIWFFFVWDENWIFNPRWRMSRDLGVTKFGRYPDEIDYKGRRVDFLGRSIPLKNMDIEESIKDWLLNGSGSTPKYLSQKAVVGLAPEKILGRIVWINPELT